MFLEDDAVGFYNRNTMPAFEEYTFKEDAYSIHSNYPRAVGNRHDSYGRVLRGGSWIDIKRDLPSSYRSRSPRDRRSIIVGFRVARTLNPLPLVF